MRKCRGIWFKPRRWAPELNQSQYQSPVNPAALGGYSVAAPYNSGGYTTTGQSALNSTAAQGSIGNTSLPTGTIGNHSQTHNPTQPQNQHLRLAPAGTMGLAPVFGTTNDGLTSLGGYSPLINIPGLGSYRIPSTIGLPGGGSIELPSITP